MLPIDSVENVGDLAPTGSITLFLLRVNNMNFKLAWKLEQEKLELDKVEQNFDLDAFL